MDTNQIMADTKRMIDDLKTVCGNFGLGNAPSEYKIITEVFLYKYLNDKFLHEIRLADDKWKNSANLEEELSKLSEDEYDDLLDELPASTAVLQREHLISYLFNHKNQKKSDGVKSFSELFDDTLVEISNLNIQIFSVHAGGEDVIKLFDAISQYVIESNKRDDFCRAIIDKLVNFSFENAFMQKYDFFAAVFEYLIKDYNKDFGKYAEYYTPHSIASIIARIMVPEKVQNVTVYDPAAGSGTLVLALAHEIGEDNCTIYTQDITQKSNEFLRLNLILNSLVHSLGNVVHGDTLLSPQHVNKNKNGLMKFDYIVSNPPFNVDFSDNRDTLAGDTYKERFWAGVPAIPKKDLDSMDIYLLFIQHIVFSMKPNGRAAIVVPTGFLTKKNKIEKTIKEHIIEKKMLKAVISMPSNIFATTGTNVSIIFLDSSQEIEKPILVDATGYGEKIKIDGKNQKTVLAEHEIEEIVDILSNRRIIEGISVFADIADIKRRNYSFSAGSFFEAKIEYEDITVEQFNEKLSGFMTELEELMYESEKSHQELLVALGSVRYDL
ncbi:MAG: class I SAM-dependent DNA methyltransferase [Candidatus Pseudoruminococcus sp.]|nr:class I SAM-dependent DNA methyltransferase [Candidatus Pseudoruminococcus sp.]